jgi:hypothetical protein
VTSVTERADFLQGTLDLLILRSLALRPLHGWGISKRIRVLSAETRMVTYPRAPHLLREPRQIHHAARETLDWFGRHLR